MIQFSITLSANQIAILRAVQAEDQLIEARKRGAVCALQGNTSQALDRILNRRITHWISGQRLLFSEKLMENTSYINDHGRPDTRQALTEKGRLVLRLVDMDIADTVATFVDVKGGDHDGEATLVGQQRSGPCGHGKS